MRLSKILAVTVWVFCCAFLFSCEKGTPQKKAQAPAQVSGAISKTVSKAEPPKTGQKVPVKKAETQSIEKISKSLEDKNQATIMELVMGQDMKYSSKGKIDPFTPLVREKEASPPQANGALPEEEPKRVLTPLEKMELSQLKLVAVILMENKKIAMVEEATGKGYEVGIGTYMGKDSGQVTQINQSSIIIKEIVKDYKGNRKERFQEMKLHKRDSGE